jgi:hypothetical protein
MAAVMMEAVRASETLVDNHFTQQCIPEDNSEYLNDEYMWQIVSFYSLPTLFMRYAYQRTSVFLSCLKNLSLCFWYE